MTGDLIESGTTPSYIHRGSRNAMGLVPPDVPLQVVRAISKPKEIVRSKSELLFVVY